MKQQLNGLLTFAVFRKAKLLNWTMAIKRPPKQIDPNDVVVALISAGSVILELWYANGSCLLRV